MKRYAIADHLTEDVKQTILSHRFVMRGESTGELDADGIEIIYHDRVPVSVDDRCCPLAYLPRIEENQSAPDGREVAAAILTKLSFEYPHDAQCESPKTRYGDCECRERLYLALVDAAEDFIEDWDHGKIPPGELAAALGVAVPS